MKNVFLKFVDLLAQIVETLKAKLLGFVSKLDLKASLKIIGLVLLLVIIYVLVKQKEKVPRIKKWFRRKETKILQVVGISFQIIIACVAYYAYRKGSLLLHTFLGVIFGLILTVLPLYIYLIKRREQILLISLTSKYLLEKDEAKIDELLGVLIAGKWETLKIDPIEEFFKSLREICLKGEVEMRRRVSEALPALFRIDLEECKALVKILRQDWDEVEWKSDNRRRVIEALPYVIKIDKQFISDNLHVLEKDEIYTIIAMVEVLDVWGRKIKKKEADKRYRELMTEMRSSHFSEEEFQSVWELRSLLELVHTNVNEAWKRFEELKHSQNIYLQICVARNFKHLCKEFPDCRSTKLCNGVPDKILDFMNFFLQEDRDINVRRPMAKEDSLECLIILLQYGTYAEKAKASIQKLLNDKDNIIRITAFDRIENILAIDRTFGKELLKNIITSNRYPKLVARANTLMRKYET